MDNKNIKISLSCPSLYKNIFDKRMLLNPDRSLVEKVINDIYNNGGYCPSQSISIKNTRCPCSDFMARRFCHCNLFIEDMEE